MSATETPPTEAPPARPAPAPADAAPEARTRGRHLRIGTWFAITRGLLLFVAVIGGIAGMISLSSLSDARRDLLDRVGPARTASMQVLQAVLNEETGVRGYLLTGSEEFLDPYRSGTRDQAAAGGQLRGFADDLGIEREVEATLTTADRWRTEYAEPAIEEGRVSRQESVGTLERGRVLFEDYRQANARLLQRMEVLRNDGRARLTNTAELVRAIFIGFVVMILLSVVATVVILRRQVVGPITALADRVRGVARGDHDQRITAAGAREVQELGDDVEEMRSQIVQEVAALETARDELERSNRELEQFAYVASHDLQEPLRKVASFCQMLQKRYGGQLDERGEQYIEFAVDGAKRMQELINDLLAFSRVGRITEEPVVVACDELVERTRRSLAASIEARGAEIVADPLPSVRGEASLLALVFQNLVGNGLKFQTEGVAPVVRITVRRDGRFWEFTVADNGIGIDAEYADRIFVIFQRLHPRNQYEGTGIGLAMCRKVVEYHGGRIWLDTDVPEGATFRFTLPVLEEEPSP